MYLVATKIIFRNKIFTPFCISNNLKKTKTTQMMAEYDHILKFWFGEDLNSLKSDSYVPNYKLWFMGGKETDDLIKSKFESNLIDAFNGKYEHWKMEAKGSMSLIILFDQFSRNIYRGTAKMFSFDPNAVEIANKLVDNELKFNELSDIEKCFVNLALIHSENAEYLLKGMNGNKNLSENGSSEVTRKIAGSFYSSAVQHYDVVKQFGRYCHRNELLGRESTPEELKFLESCTYDFVKSVKRKDK